MAKKSVKRPETEINPMFFIPDGVDELTYSDSQGEGASGETISDIGELLDSGLFEDYNFSEITLGAPEILGVAGQTVRTNESGNQVVDLVVLVEDIPGATEYDFRVTKI